MSKKQSTIKEKLTQVQIDLPEIMEQESRARAEELVNEIYNGTKFSPSVLIRTAHANFQSQHFYHTLNFSYRVTNAGIEKTVSMDIPMSKEFMTEFLSAATKVLKKQESCIDDVKILRNGFNNVIEETNERLIGEMNLI